MSSVGVHNLFPCCGHRKVNSLPNSIIKHLINYAQLHYQVHDLCYSPAHYVNNNADLYENRDQKPSYYTPLSVSDVAAITMRPN